MNFDEVLRLRNQIDKLVGNINSAQVNTHFIDEEAYSLLGESKERAISASRSLDKVLVEIGKEITK